MMTSSKYLEESARTAHTPHFINGDDVKAAYVTAQLMHAAMGMVTEAGELEEALQKKGAIDRVNLCEELGDMLWYVALALRTLEKTLDDVAPLALEFAASFEREHAAVADLRWAISGLITSSATLMDQLKKHMIYDKPLDAEQFFRVVSQVTSFIMFASVELNVEMGELCERNIAKLRKRYPDKFNAEQALNRDLDAERAALEGGSR